MLGEKAVKEKNLLCNKEKGVNKNYITTEMNKT